jgi:hypothetical protein
MTGDHQRSTTDLTEPLLSPQQQDDDPLSLLPQQQPSHDNSGETTTIKRDLPCASASATTTTTTPPPFTIQNEIIEMLNLALPLAVSFFCRMGMASTDRCVGQFPIFGVSRYFDFLNTSC